MARPSVVEIAVLWLTVHASIGWAYRRWSDLQHGKIRPDGVEYFDFVVHDNVLEVAVALSLIHDGSSFCSGCGSSAELLLRFGPFPTASNHDQRSLASRSEPARVVVEQLRTGRYYVSVGGGELFGSAAALAGARRAAPYLLNVTYTACAQALAADHDEATAPCAAAFSVAPPSLDGESVFPSANYKVASQSVEGCVDWLRPTLRYTFHVERPQWDLSLTLSTTFAAGFRMTAFTRHHNMTALPDSEGMDRFVQSASISPGAGFRSTSVHFTAPPIGRWTIAITGNMTNNSTCVNNGGAVFAFEAHHGAENCSREDNDSTNYEVATNAGICTVGSAILEPSRVSVRAGENALDSWFVSDRLVDYNSNQHFAVAYSAEIGAVFAGGFLQLQVETNGNLTSFQVLARVDAYPTLDQFTFRFKSSEATQTDIATASTSSGLLQQHFLWQPILYPVAGSWQLVLLEDDAETSLPTSDSRYIAVNASLRSFACPDHDQDACSSHGSCGVSISANGRSYSTCTCDYGFAGEQCGTVSIDRTYRGTQIFFVMVSNVAILPAVWLSCRRQLHAETVLFTATGVVSTLYHACDFDLFCTLRFSDLHHIDSALVFNVVLVLIVHISGARNQFKAGLLVFYLLSMMLLSTADEGDSSVTWAIIAIICVVQLSLAITYYVIVGSRRMGLGKSIALKAFLFHSKNFDRRYGFAGCMLLGIGLICWFATTPSNYWIIHSLWHISAMLAAFCIIGLRLTDRYQLITPDFSIDVLATPPQFRFAVSSVKSVDILEDMSESSRAVAWR